MNWKITLVISFVILALAGGVLGLIFSTEPEAERAGATRKTAMLVDVVEAERGTFQPLIAVMGTVVPEQEIVLSPRVSGEILSLSPAFTPGGFVEKGDLLVEIDPADYEAVVLERKSALRQAMADLELEKGRQDVAEQDYALLGEQLSGENRSLVLREPQLDSALAQVEAARAALRRAELDLERTRILAPFNAHIIDRQANVGSLVSPGQAIGTLVGIDAYWVEAAVPVSKVKWIAFPDTSSGEGARARVRDRAAWPEEVYREGTVHRLIGSLEPQTRLARVLVAIPDPLARFSGNGAMPRLIIGSFVETLINGMPIEDVVRINRDHLRKNDTVWVKKEGKLQIREVNIIFRDRDFAYVTSGLEEGDAVVTTNLSTVVEGAGLRLEGETQ